MATVDDSANTKNQDWRIAFFPSEDGAIDASCGTTAWSYLPTIFALGETRKQDGRADWRSTFQTDNQGLKRLSDIADEAETSLADAVEVLGLLLARADIAELAPDNIHTVGWLLAGLMELRESVSFVRKEADYHLEQGGYPQECAA